MVKFQELSESLRTSYMCTTICFVVVVVFALFLFFSHQRVTEWRLIDRLARALVLGGGSFLLACEDLGKMFDTSFPTCALYIYIYMFRLARAH